MNEAFKEKASLRVRKAISLLEKLSDLSYAEDADQTVIEVLVKSIEEAIFTNKEKLLRRETPKNKEKDIIEFEDEETEEQLSNIPIEQRRVYSDKSDRSIQELYNRFLEGDLILQPDFQRYYVWDDKKASLLVESVMLEVPLPIFYLAEESKGKFTVIDGQQRLVSLFRFLSPMKLGNQEIDQLKLKGLEVLTSHIGNYYKDLPVDLKKNFSNSTVRVIEIRAESHPDVKFEIFERLNTGAVKLNDQELRNCVYRGRYNVFLKELAEDKDFLGLIGLKAPHPRMVERELLLRFLAFHHNTYLKYNPPMKQFLNKEMQKNRNLDGDEEKSFRTIFKNSVELSKVVFGNNAFKRFASGTSKSKPNGQWEKKKVNRALFDLIMVGFSSYEKNQIVPKADVIREEFLHLMTNDQVFIDSVLFTTDKKEKINYRFKRWLQSLEEIVGLPKTEKRNFSLEFKERLWRSNKTCKICGQRIHELDDAEVDHIEHYWRGGKTIPSNARLVHRFCNRSRGGGEMPIEGSVNRKTARTISDDRSPETSISLKKLGIKIKKTTILRRDVPVEDLKGCEFKQIAKHPLINDADISTMLPLVGKLKGLSRGLDVLKDRVGDDVIKAMIKLSFDDLAYKISKIAPGISTKKVTTNVQLLEKFGIFIREESKVNPEVSAERLKRIASQFGGKSIVEKED